MELQAARPDLNIEIVGVNLADASASMDLVTSLSTFPWVQDSMTAAVWERWQTVKDDLVILDSQNQRQTLFNLGMNDLSVPENRETLKQLFLKTATVADTDGDQLPDDWEQQYFGGLAARPGEDVDGDGRDNFTEFAFGTNPNDSRSATPVQINAVVVRGQNQASIAFRRRAGSVLDYFIETSPDLSHWTSVTSDLVEVSPPQNLFDGTGTSLVRATMRPSTNGLSCGFVRVRALPRLRP